MEIRYKPEERKEEKGREKRKEDKKERKNGPGFSSRPKELLTLGRVVSGLGKIFRITATEPPPRWEVPWST